MQFRFSLHSSRRPGKILALFALLLPALLGMVGLIIGAGLLLAAHRQAQNAADAAALAAAQARVAGGSTGDAAAAAQAVVPLSGGLDGAVVTVNIPPSQGAYAGNSNYVEVIISQPAETWFIQVVGAGPPTVAARAVAGIETLTPPQAVLALDPAAVPGLAVSQATLQVNGRVGVNSQGAGVDAAGNSINLGFPSAAVTTGSNGILQAAEVRVVGGVDAPGNVQNLSGQAGSPLNAGTLPLSDPFQYLPCPTLANGVVNSFPGVNGQSYGSPHNVSVSVSEGQTVPLSPGIYQSIEITGPGPGQVTFNQGVYLLRGGNANGHALQIVTGAAVTANGVLFYNTGADYDVGSGQPDAGDGDTMQTVPSPSSTFGDVTINAGGLQLTPLTDGSSPFQGIWLYQRRWNPKGITVQTNSSQDVLAGTLYARWANCALAGPGGFQGQYLVGSLGVTGSGSGGTVTISPAGSLGKSGQVFLVE